MKMPTSSVDPFVEKKRPVHVREYACTIVNLLPYSITEEKPHMLPSAFTIPAGIKNSDGTVTPGIFHVLDGIHYVPNPLIDEGKPGSSIKQTTPAREMARSICEDYNCAHVATDEGSEPGLFWVEGRLDADEVLEYNKEQYDHRLARMKNWFRNLIALADADWQKNKNMMAVSDLQREAARFLGVQKEWVDYVAVETLNCKFCTTPVPLGAIVCPNCKNVLDAKKYEEMKNA
jgi:hypothetical protein